MALLDDFLNSLDLLPDDKRQQLIEQVKEDTSDMRWVPNPGAQTLAYNSTADVIGFGGEAGPGKTALIVGLALNKHTRSLVLRKTNKEAKDIADAFVEALGHEDGLNRSQGTWRMPGKLIDYGGCEHDKEKQKYKGRPHDLISFDEVVDFPRETVEFIMQWNRTTNPAQPCCTLMTFNPPTSPVGMWVIEYFGPWLDPKHPRPAEFGELRWFTTIDGVDTEVDGRGPHLVDDEMIEAKSRTFIRGYLSENPFLANTGYDATRAAAPKAMREAYRKGNFEASLSDIPGQCIPSAWVRAAQDRWSAYAPPNVPMCAIGVDCSGGGDDPMVLAPRHDGWFAPLIEIKGADIPKDRPGRFAAGIVVSERHNDALIIVDMGGGYGGPLYEKLYENNISAQAYKGAEKSVRRTRDGKMGFTNKRSETIWRFREALDPDQPGGSPIALPPDDRVLFADLTTPTFEETPRGIKVESKESVCTRLGRSTNHGDAVVMSWGGGPTYITGELVYAATQEYGTIATGRYPKVAMSRAPRTAPRR